MGEEKIIDVDVKEVDQETATTKETKEGFWSKTGKKVKSFGKDVALPTAKAVGKFGVRALEVAGGILIFAAGAGFMAGVVSSGKTENPEKDQELMELEVLEQKQPTIIDVDASISTFEEKIPEE